MSAFTLRKYIVPPELATAFTPQEINELKQNFNNFDTNSDGTIDANELGNVLRNCGRFFNPSSGQTQDFTVCSKMIFLLLQMENSRSPAIQFQYRWPWLLVVLRFTATYNKF